MFCVFVWLVCATVVRGLFDPEEAWVSRVWYSIGVSNVWNTGRELIYGVPFNMSIAVRLVESDNSLDSAITRVIAAQN